MTEMKRRSRPAQIIPAAALLLCIINYNGNGDETTRECLARGEILTERICENGLNGVRTTFVVRAGRETIWQTLIDYDHFLDIFDDVDSIAVQRCSAETAEVEIWTKPVFRHRYNYTLRRTCEKARWCLRWKKIRGDFKTIRGSWEICRSNCPGYSRIVHTSFVKYSKVIPDIFVQMVSEKKGRQTAWSIIKWIERDRVAEKEGSWE
jgi:ribosome-associated toxin RatA of RatAB toxin-antitoxin module